MEDRDMSHISGAQACVETMCISDAKSTYCEFQQWSHAGEQLHDERFAVEDVELLAAELDALPQ